MSRLFTEAAGVAKTLHRAIVFSPRNTDEVKAFADKIVATLSTNPRLIQVTDLQESQKNAGLFKAIRISLACGVDSTNLLPHVSLVADRERKILGINTFEELRKLGINQALVVSGVAKNFDVTRKNIGEFYSDDAQVELKAFAESVPEDFKIALTLYTDGHAATHKTFLEILTEQTLFN